MAERQPTMADLVAYLRRKRGNAAKVVGNDAASTESRAQARDFGLMLDVLLAMFTSPGAAFDSEEAHQLIRHAARLFEVLSGDLRGGLHLGEGDMAK